MNLLKVTKVNKSEEIYQSVDLWNPLPNLPVYGGQLIAQALYSSYDSIDSFRINSLYCQFLSPGDIKEPIDYNVTKIKDGRTFKVRKVEAVQKDKIILTLNASFCKMEEAISFNYQQTKFDVTNIEFNHLNNMLLTDENNGYNEAVKKNLQVLYDHFEISYATENKKRYFKFELKKVADNKKEICCFVAFISDFLLIESGLMVLDVDIKSGIVDVMASVDHSLHIHQDINFDEDTFYLVAECDRIMGTSICCKGYILNKRMDLVGTAYQEGMIKLKK